MTERAMLHVHVPSDVKYLAQHKSNVFQRGVQHTSPKDKPFEDVVTGPKESRNFSSGALNAHAIDKVTISDLARDGQADLENHLRLRAPQTW